MPDPYFPPPVRFKSDWPVFLVLAVLLGILALALSALNSCASTEQALAVTERTNIAAHSQMRRAMHARCLEVAETCEVPADDCTQLLRCQRVRRIVDDGVIGVLLAIGAAQQAIEHDSMHDVSVHLATAARLWADAQKAYGDYVGIGP